VGVTKILMVTERYLPIWGGAENQLHQLIPHLVQQGCEVKVVTRRWHKHYPTQETLDNVDVFRLGVPGVGFLPTVVFIFSLIGYFWGKRNEIDVLHSHGAVKMGALCAIFARLLGLKNVTKIATAGKIPALQGTSFGNIILYLFKKSDAIIAMTSEISAELTLIATPAEVIVKITNGVDASRFISGAYSEKKQWKVEQGLQQEAKIVLFSSRLVHRKGLDVLLAAWPTITRKYPEAHLVIVGSGADQSDSVEKVMKKMVVDKGLERVMFVGETKVPEQFLKIADIFVFPSRREGFPNALLEALSCGLAVVASHIGGVTAVLGNSDICLTFRPEDSGDLSRQILKMLDDEELAKEKGALARELMLTEYSFQSISSQYLTLYTRLTDSLQKTNHPSQ